MCGKVYAATQAIASLKIYLEQGISAHYGPEDASTMFPYSSNDQRWLIITGNKSFY